GGKTVFVDYHRPSWINPFRYIMFPILGLLEPFAMDMWHHEITDWLDPNVPVGRVEKETYFGGLYQKVVFYH
ncbi:MAG: methyltransferase, partial [Magnetococcales bacterium]|nr:methyltransferase [Magnetococcales bacterium]